MLLINDFMQFFYHHWLLWSLLIVCLGLLLSEQQKKKISGIPMILPQHAVNLINHQHAVVLDVRDSDAFREQHLLGARHWAQENDFALQVKTYKLKKEKPIVLYGDTKQKALRCALVFKKAQFSQIYCLQGDLPAWQAEGLPLASE